MRQNVSISIIVPVHKAEEYLSRCIDSILGQTFRNFELLLIDDGSPDNSGNICEEYAARDSRIRVFHKENGGVSSARQCGIENAAGKYSIHADPDDWIEPDMLECMYAKAEETGADMVFSDFFIETKDGGRISEENPYSTDSKIVLKRLLSNELHGNLWSRLIRHSIYKEHGIRFPETINLMEDKYVICEILRHGCKTAYINKAFYHYDCFTNDNSLVRRFSPDSVRQLKEFVAHFENVLDNDEYKDAIYRQKVQIKEWIFCEHCLSNQKFVDLFQEINNRYISENRIRLRLIGALGKDSRLKLSERIAFSIFRKFVRKVYRITKNKNNDT